MCLERHRASLLLCFQNIVYNINQLNFRKMNEKHLTEKESLEVITAMIARTKLRYALGDGNIMLMWGYLSVAVSLAVWALLCYTHHNAVNWLWFAIPIVGGIVTPLMRRSRRCDFGAVSYSDRLISRMWTIVGFSFLFLTLVCFAFIFIANINCWTAMLVYSLIAVPIAETVQGIALKERSMLWGGVMALAVGMFTLCCAVGGVRLAASWFMPLFILAFVVMMIVPGHILNHKARKAK